MTEDKIKALKASRQSRLERAITPTSVGGGYAHRYNPPSITLKPPKWEVWGNMREVEWHEACALALNIDPNTVVEEGGDMYPHDSWYRLPSHEIKEDFEDLMKLLRSNLRDFTSTYNNTVLLSEFANFCVRIKWKNLPQELVALAQENPQAAPAAKGEGGTGTTPGDDDVEEQAADDHDEKLAALFDPLPVEALAKMFMIDLAQWKKWQDKAKANGLSDARQGTALFNPYKAGVWLVRKGTQGWDDAHLFRTLVKNLPARSLDDKHLLTGGID